MNLNLLNCLKELQNILRTSFECNPCTSYDLFKMQWSQSLVTKKLLGKDSIEDGEQVFGFLEFNKFYIERLASDPQFLNSQVSLEQAEWLLKIDFENFTIFKGWDTLIHKTNIRDFLQAFQDQDTKKQDELVSRFKLKDNHQALAIYKYLVYIGEELVPMSDVEGTMEKAGMGSFFGEYAELYTKQGVEFIHKEIFGLSFKNFFLEQKSSCQ